MYVFQGIGFIPGVPGRDLTNQEAKDYGVEDSPLYVNDPSVLSKTHPAEAVGAALELDAVSEDEQQQQALEDEINEGVGNGNGS